VFTGGTHKCGAHGTNFSVADVWDLNPVTGGLRGLPSMKKARSCHACVEIKKQLYVFGAWVVDTANGGTLSGDYVKECERFADYQWRFVTPLPTKLRAVTADAYNGQIYLTGRGTTSIFQFNPPKNIFSELKVNLKEVAYAPLLFIDSGLMYV